MLEHIELERYAHGVYLWPTGWRTLASLVGNLGPVIRRMWSRESHWCELRISTRRNADKSKPNLTDQSIKLNEAAADCAVRTEMMKRLRCDFWSAVLGAQLLNLLTVAATTLGAGAALPAPIDWRYNDAQYGNAEYDKMLGEGNEQQPGNFHFQYVDYQPKCGSGGQPVCATNGSMYFYFENDCKLEAANMKLLFQYGIGKWSKQTKQSHHMNRCLHAELEPIELERCLPQCDTARCTTVYAPVCAAANNEQPVTFANECEAHRRGCLTKQGE